MTDDEMAEAVLSGMNDTLPICGNSAAHSIRCGKRFRHWVLTDERGKEILARPILCRNCYHVWIATGALGRTTHEENVLLALLHGAGVREYDSEEELARAWPDLKYNGIVKNTVYRRSVRGRSPSPKSKRADPNWRRPRK